jgi:acetyl esterase/lipase
MAYTIHNTPNEIMEGDWLVPYKGFFFNTTDYDKPLTSWCNEWINTEYLENTVQIINYLKERHEKEPDLFIPIWEGLTEEKEEVSDIILIPFLIDKESPCYIVCPGGGYVCNCISQEGVETALELNKHGKNAVVLTYRVAPYRFPKPQQDLVRAIQYVRANAKRFHVKDNKIILMGYSAAGHLCGSVGALYEKIPMPNIKIPGEDRNYDESEINKRPNGIILNYPVISFVQEPHVGSADSLLGETADYETRKSLSVENLVDKNYPPTFVWHCEGDDLVYPSNSKNMAKALAANEVPHELHLYPGGGHGCVLAAHTNAAGWITKAVDFIDKNLE